MASRKKQETAANENPALKPIWPDNFVLADENAPEGVLSPIPVFTIIGASNTGKSTVIQSIAPTKPGEKPRTRIQDFEGSHAALRIHVSSDVIDMRKKSLEVARRKNPNINHYTPYDMFIAWWEDTESIEPGQYAVLGTDTIDAVIAGAHTYVMTHAAEFGKHEAQFRGKEGTIYAWGEVEELLMRILLKAATKVQTIALASHVKDEWKNNVRTGRKEASVKDRLTKVSTLIIWLDHDPETGHREAQVQKQRLSTYIWKDKDGNELPRFRIGDSLPMRLIPKKIDGFWQSYPELIYDYMANPQVYSDEINTIPEEKRADLPRMSKAEKLETEQRMTEQELTLKTSEAKQRLLVDLRKDFPGTFPDGAAIGAALTALGLEYALDRDIEIRAKLKAYAQEQGHGW